MTMIQKLIRHALRRPLELILLQFFVVVILPNSVVGTANLPAVNAKRVAAVSRVRAAVPPIGKLSVNVAAVRHARLQSDAGRAPRSLLAVRVQTTALLAQRLRI